MCSQPNLLLGEQTFLQREEGCLQLVIFSVALNMLDPMKMATPSLTHVRVHTGGLGLYWSDTLTPCFRQKLGD